MIEMRNHMKQKLLDSPTKFARLSVLAAIATISLKALAYLVTDSVGLLSDAFESGVNLIAALVTLVALLVAAIPPDDNHAYGHSKVEYFASGVEGTLILVAAITIVISAVDRFLNLKPLENIGIRLGISFIATILNFIVVRTLKKGGERHNSIALLADADHLFTNVWVSAGVMIGVILVAITDYIWLDPLIAILVAINIVYTGTKIIKQPILGLMDTALPKVEQQKTINILQSYEDAGISFHALRTRQSASQRFALVHIQVSGFWSVQQGHSLMEEIEESLRIAILRINVLTHLEPLEDPVS